MKSFKLGDAVVRPEDPLKVLVVISSTVDGRARVVYHDENGVRRGAGCPAPREVRRPDALAWAAMKECGPKWRAHVALVLEIDEAIRGGLVG